MIPTSRKQSPPVHAWRSHPLLQPALDAVLLLPAAALIVGDRGYAIAGALLAVFWLVHLPTLRRTRHDVVLNGLLLAATGLAILIYTTQAHGPASRPAFWGLLLHVALVRAAADWPWDAGWNRLLGAALALLAVALTILAFVGTDWKLNRGLLPARLASAIRGLPHLVQSVQTSHGSAAGFPNNEVAGTLAIVAFIPLAWLLFRQLDWTSLPAAALLIAMGIVELMADSKTALAAIGMGGICLLGLHWWRAGAAAALLVAVLVAVQWGTVSHAISGDDRRTPATHETSLSAREDIWRHGLNYAGDHLLTGIGMNRFADVYLADPTNHHSEGQDLPAHVHDFYLQLVLDLGIGGLLLFAALLALAVQGAVQGWRSCLPADRWLVAALIGGTVTALAFGIVDEVAPGAKAGIPLWVELGLLAGLARCPRSRPR